MPDLIVIRDPKTGQEFEAPAGTPIPSGYEPVTSKGPLAQAVDTMASSYREKAAGAAEGVAQVLDKLGIPRGGITSKVGTGLVAPAPTVAGKAVETAQTLTAPLGLAARLIAPTAAGVGGAALEGSSPWEGGALGLTSTALGEATAGVTNLGRGLYAARGSRAATEAAGAREAQALSAGMRDVLPEIGPLLQRGNYDELLAFRDKLAGARSVVAQQKEAVEQAIAQKFAGQRLSDKYTMPPGAPDDVTGLMAHVKGLEADARRARAGLQPLSGRGGEAIADAAQANAFLQRVLAEADPALQAAYQKSVTDFDKALRLEEIARAATSNVRTNTPDAGNPDTQAVRALLQKKRERFPQETYGPVMDAVQLGRGNATASYEVPWFLRSFAPAPSTVSTVARPGAPQPTDVPPALLSVILGRALNSFMPGTR